MNTTKWVLSKREEDRGKLLSLLLVPVASLFLIVMTGELHAHFRPYWHCHPYSVEYVRCHRTGGGALVPRGDPNIRMSTAPYYGEIPAPIVRDKNGRRYYLEHSGGKKYRRYVD